ncbi:hypothetical protein [Endozoicomonas sp.]|uniref:hypothetical protein n=1 Tax=Endozoicomonas sp. TaxID=1892382 RepID=UPI002886384F|nr:hypothetical protein [Endozoicomonas sp.]
MAKQCNNDNTGKVQNQTTIAVAHRLATIQDADQILVMHKRKIVQRGKHEELLQVKGHYRDLYLAQQTEKPLGTAQQSGVMTTAVNA